MTKGSLILNLKEIGGKSFNYDYNSFVFILYSLNYCIGEVRRLEPTIKLLPGVEQDLEELIQPMKLIGISSVAQW